jgi:hypothetical protein
MPTYNFRNIETDEEFEIFMSIHDLDKYKQDNPHLQQFHNNFPGVVSDAGIRDKRPDGWRDVLKGIKKANYGSTIET